MSSGKKSDRTAGQSDQKAVSPAAAGKSVSGSLMAAEKIVVRDFGGGPAPVARKFPGPRNADAALRVTFERRAYADLLAHAKESLDVEVCGVLAGHVCEDEEGVFVSVEAAIRGAAAAEASTHVTFTQETWTAIHKTLEQEHPKLRMVGWYHTHPGFGVQFSDMDLFIQKNFFSGPTQIALVTDPLSGAVAICVNTRDGARYLPRFWVDGREQPAKIPGSEQPAGSAAPEVRDTGRGDAAMQQLEARVAQLVQVIDEQQASYHRFLLFCGFVFCLAVIGSTGYFIYNLYVSRLEPPRVTSFAPVPVQVGDKTVLLGVGIVEWKVPDELNAILVQAELARKLAAEKEAKAAAAKGDTNAPASSSTTTTNSKAASPSH